MDHRYETRLAELMPLLHGDFGLDAVAAAIAVEQGFGVVLRDEDIVPERLCSERALIATLPWYLDNS